MESGKIAKAVIISSLFTLLIVSSLIILSRHWIADYLRDDVAVSTEQTATKINALSDNHQIVSTIEKVNPAVVSVIVTKDVPVYERYYESYGSSGLFGGFSVPKVRENGTVEKEVGGGSGFIVSNDGLIVTNRHVVEDEAARYSVFLNDGTAYKVEVLGRDTQLDIAILKIAEPLKSALTYATFGDSDTLKLGQSVIAIGNALAEFRNSVSVGVVSGLARSITASDSMGHTEQLEEVIQTDAAINPGNSGGPLLNITGEVVGVNVATSRNADNIGFALPANIVKVVVDSVREYGEIIRPFLGINYIMIDEELEKSQNLSSAFGALVVNTDSGISVVPGSSAEQAGISEGAIILAIDGEELHNTDLATVLRKKKVGQEIKLKIIQAGAEKTVSVTLTKAP